MNQYCRFCGAPLPPNVKFCGSCGAQTQIADTPAYALSSSGEVSFSHSSPPTKSTTPAIGPFKFLGQGLTGLFRGFGASFASKKRWIPALVLALLWFVLTLLPLLGVNPTWIRWLSVLTFANGGTSGGIAGLVGGVVGKGVFAYFLMSLVVPITRGQKPFSGVGSGVKQFFPALAAKSLSQFAPLLSGAGVALILYNFMAGTASLPNSMVGIAAFLLSLRALSGKAGFLRRFLGTFKGKKRTEESTHTATDSRVIAGLATGFALGVALSALSIKSFQLPYMLGAVLLIAGLILQIAGRSAKERIVQ